MVIFLVVYTPFQNLIPPNARNQGLDMALSATAVQQAKPKEKPYRLADEKGLFAHIMPNGSKYWRLKYRFAGKQKLLALGVYPDISLKEARHKRDEARKLLANDIDPGEVKKVKKSAKGLAKDSLGSPSPKTQDLQPHQ
jgi:Arm DNA-binding domain